MHGGPQRPRLLQVAEGQLGRMHPQPLGLVHGASRLVVVDVVATQRVGIKDLRIVIEDLAQHLRLPLQHRHPGRTVRHVQVAARLHIAIDVGNQPLEVLHAIQTFGMQRQRRVQPPACDPLRAGQATGGTLGLTPIAHAASPAHAVGFQHGGPDAVITRQCDGGRQPGEAGADDGHIHLAVAVDGAIVRGRLTGRGNPVGR